MLETGRRSLKPDKITVAIVGAGNVATRLSLALHAAGVGIESVSASHIESARRLAAQVGARAVPVREISACTDYVLVVVSDKAVAEVAASLPPTDAIVAHTSGSVPLETLAGRFRSAAVLYPLQTFSRDVGVDVGEVPFFTEATDAATLEAVDHLAHVLSDHVYHADSEQRKSLHVAGVLTSNFPIYLLEMARQALAKAGYPLEVVEPLARASIAKAFAVGPREALTGPARRGDVAVTELQAQSLPPQHRAIYESITQSILKDYHE